MGILSLTATPIPRTLGISLSGLRDLSIISTPPKNRLPIKTFIKEHSETLIKNAIDFELSRGGQIYFLHNKINTIEKRAKKIKELLPEIKISIGHGKMEEKFLEDTMINFFNK